MEYQHIKKGVFIDRPNRFIAKVGLEGEEITCHVKNTGRCRELLIPGVPVYVEYHPDARETGRKTAYSLIGVQKGSRLINMDSQAPNQAAYEWLLSRGAQEIRREVRLGDSRFDLAFRGRKGTAYMEVKGVTLEEGGVARFPDAPTLRGLKHIRELGSMAQKGGEAYLLFVIQMKGVCRFEPNMVTQPEFGHALTEAAACGVHILAFDCLVTENSLTVHSPVPVSLPQLNSRG